jgi:hypothetical protein
VSPDPVRVAFIGRAVEQRHFTLSTPAGGLDPTFHDVRDGYDQAALIRELGRPDVVVNLRPDLAGPEIAPDAVTLAVVTEHAHAPWSTDVWSHDDRAPHGLTGYDRVAATDPRVGGTWRSFPLPVDDALYAPDDRPAPRPLKPLAIGESTTYRERWLTDAKHHYELSHYAFGLTGDRLKEVLDVTNVGVVLHAEQGATAFPPEAALHLAAGHLLIAERLVPPRGLEPGLDHLQVDWPHQLMHVLYQVHKRPEAFEQVRIRGRIRADELRASQIWPRVVHDLLADVRAFGR